MTVIDDSTLLAKMLEGQEKFPHLYTKFNKKQTEFLGLKSFIRAYFAGNGAGKTRVAAEIIANAVSEPSKRNAVVKEFLKDIPFPCNIRIVATMSNITQALVPTLEKVLPKDTYTTDNQRKPYTASWKFKNGCRIQIMTSEQDVKEFAGPTLEIVWIDEPLNRDKYIENLSRLRAGGIMILTLTPITEDSNWMVEDIIENKSGADAAYVYASVWDNCKENGGFLEKSSVDRIVSQYDQDEYDARVEGKFRSFVGRIYRVFDEEKHVIEPIEIPKQWTRYVACDPHDRKPFAMLWCAVDPMNRAYIYAEHPVEDFAGAPSDTVSSAARMISMRESIVPSRIKLIDKFKGNSPASVGGCTIIEEFEKYGIYFETIECSSVSSGHLIVKDMLDFNEAKEPRLFIFNNCKNTIRQMRYYSNDDLKSGKDKYKDFPDCIRFLAVYGLKYIPPEGMYATPLTPATKFDDHISLLKKRDNDDFNYEIG